MLTMNGKNVSFETVRCACGCGEELLKYNARGQPVRFLPGHNNVSRKLTAEDVRLIRALQADGMSVREIAGKFEVSYSAVHAIVTGKNWRWLK